MTEVLLEGELYALELETPLHARLGTPARDPLPGGDYYCPIEVLDNQSGEMHLQTAVFGINPMQAVENAFQCLRSHWPIVIDTPLKKN